MKVPLTSEIGERIRKLRKQRGWTQKQLAEYSHASRGTIINIENMLVGETNDINLTDIAKALNIPYNELIQPSDMPPRAAKTIFDELKSKYDLLETAEIPIIGSIPAGNLEVKEQEPEEFITIPKEELGMRANLSSLFALRVSGNSLDADGIMDGQIVVIDPDAPLMNGKIYAVQIENQVVARHVEWVDDMVILKASNSGYKEIPVTEFCNLGRIILSGSWKKH